MSLSLNRRALLGVVVLCVVGVVGQRAISKPAASSSIQAKGESAQITALLTERRDLLRHVERLYLAQYQQGQGTLEDLQRASRDEIHADLDLPHSRAERIALLQNWVDKTQDYAKLAEQRVKVGTALQSEVYEARVAHLEAQIDLEREKSGHASP